MVVGQGDLLMIVVDFRFSFEVIVNRPEPSFDYETKATSNPIKIKGKMRVQEAKIA